MTQTTTGYSRHQPTTEVSQEPPDVRTVRAARSLAHFEGSDAFDGPDTAERRVARNEYLTRVAALLARAGTVSNDRRPTQKPTNDTDTVLAVSFTRKVTSGQLAAMAPAEITALFGALHAIASTTQPASER